MLAVAHELSWRHAVVAAARESDPSDWRALTVAHEAATYEYLLGWIAVTYDVAGGRRACGADHAPGIASSLADPAPLVASPPSRGVNRLPRRQW